MRTLLVSHIGLHTITEYDEMLMKYLPFLDDILWVERDGTAGYEMFSEVTERGITPSGRKMLVLRDELTLGDA